MFSLSAQYYDRIYSFKDYDSEIKALLTIAKLDRLPASSSVLDVACGTGEHIRLLRARFPDIEGLDVSPDFVELASQKNPGIQIHQASMLDFETGRLYDLITCLFSSIGYMKTRENLSQAVKTMAAHLQSGGKLVLEPWFTPQDWQVGRVHSLKIDSDDFNLVRMNTSMADGNLSYFDFHYLVGTPDEVQHFVERHEMGLFEREEMETAFKEAGLTVEYHAQGLMGRGLYIGHKE